MSRLRRFPLHYDEQFDRDIHELLMRTPEKRRSERLRNLIRLGLATQSPAGTKEVSSPGVLSPVREASLRNEKNLSAQHKPVRFEPPS